jgi:sulfatase modifying factor 1
VTLLKGAVYTQSSGGFEFVSVEGGTFQMGSTVSDDEKPIHSVTLNSFSIGKYEVTQKQWQSVMGNNPSNFKGDNLPVEQVSWNDIQDFIEKLNQKEKTNAYRLPTEAEWEYAARGGNKSNGYTYSGSNSIDNVAWYSSNSGSTTHTVGTKQANELGVYDMSGNVWEWCNDWYEANYYKNSAGSNPQGASTGSVRVLRGGSWDFFGINCRVADRGGSKPDNRFVNYGFRLVRTN